MDTDTEFLIEVIRALNVCCPECGEVMDYEYDYDDYYYCDNDDCKFYRVVRLMD